MILLESTKGPVLWVPVCLKAKNFFTEMLFSLLGKSKFFAKN